MVGTYFADAVLLAYPEIVELHSAETEGEFICYDADHNLVVIDNDRVAGVYSNAQSNSEWWQLRNKRNGLIEKSDWMANSDITMTDEWTTYRQSLRDLPANTTDPADPTWPTPPS